MVLRDGEEPGAPPGPASLPALMRGNESDALVGRKSFVLVSAREAWCQITNAVG